VGNVDPDGRGADVAVGRNTNPVEQVGQAVADIGADIGGYIRSQREGAQVSLRQLAKAAGVSNPYLSQVERGLRKPSAEILQQIAKGLRISAEALYVRAGFLEQRPASAVADAVLADPDLTERQKQVLLDVYQSFRREGGDPAAPITTTTAATTTIVADPTTHEE
jgi:transcriptional regulator with XRE-family HTH domain